MSPDFLFQFLSFAPGPLWLFLLLCPRNKWAMRIFDGFLILGAGIFTWRVLPEIPTLLPLIAKPTLSGIQSMLSTPEGTVSAWNHFILADLWMGRWSTYDALTHSFPTLVRIFTLIAILFFGPAGLFFYLIYRAIRLKKVTLVESRT